MSRTVVASGTATRLQEHSPEMGDDPFFVYLCAVVSLWSGPLNLRSPPFAPAHRCCLLHPAQISAVCALRTTSWQKCLFRDTFLVAALPRYVLRGEGAEAKGCSPNTGDVVIRMPVVDKQECLSYHRCRRAGVGQAFLLVQNSRCLGHGHAASRAFPGNGR